MPTVSLNGAELFYVEQGSGPETVVFSHSYLVDHRHFEPQIDALSERYRVIAYDHRGHGRSGPPPAGFDMESIYDDAIGVIEATGAAPCHFIGLSTGGFVGQRIAIRRPELLTSLTLMDTSADPEPRLKRLQYEAMFVTVKLAGYRPVIGEVMRKMFGRSFLRDPARASERRQWRERLMENDRDAMIRFGRAIFSREGVYGKLGGLPVPTLVVVGEADGATPPERARRIAEAVPGARLEVIPKAGHLCTIEEPERVSRVLLDFLGAHAAA